VIITAQYLYQIPPVVRNNMDFILAGQGNRKSLQLLTDDYLLGNIDTKEFEKMYYRCTSNYHFLIINNNSVKDNDDLNTIYGTISTPPKYIK
jgi:hypothetical protein